MEGIWGNPSLEKDIRKPTETITKTNKKQRALMKAYALPVLPTTPQKKTDLLAKFCRVLRTISNYIWDVLQHVWECVGEASGPILSRG